MDHNRPKTDRQFRWHRVQVDKENERHVAYLYGLSPPCSERNSMYRQDLSGEQQMLHISALPEVEERDERIPKTNTLYSYLIEVG